VACAAWVVFFLVLGRVFVPPRRRLARHRRLVLLVIGMSGLLARRRAGAAISIWADPGLEPDLHDPAGRGALGRMAERARLVGRPCPWRTVSSPAAPARELLGPFRSSSRAADASTRSAPRLPWASSRGDRWAGLAIAAELSRGPHGATGADHRDRAADDARALARSVARATWSPW